MSEVVSYNNLFQQMAIPTHGKTDIRRLSINVHHRKVLFHQINIFSPYLVIMLLEGKEREVESGKQSTEVFDSFFLAFQPVFAKFV